MLSTKSINLLFTISQACGSRGIDDFYSADLQDWGFGVGLYSLLITSFRLNTKEITILTTRCHARNNTNVWTNQHISSQLCVLSWFIFFTSKPYNPFSIRRQWNILKLPVYMVKKCDRQQLFRPADNGLVICRGKSTGCFHMRPSAALASPAILSWLTSPRTCLMYSSVRFACLMEN